MDTVVIGDRMRVGGGHPVPLWRALGTGERARVSGRLLLEAAGAVPAGGTEARTRRRVEPLVPVRADARRVLDARSRLVRALARRTLRPRIRLVRALAGRALSARSANGGAR